MTTDRIAARAGPASLLILLAACGSQERGGAAESASSDVDPGSGNGVAVVETNGVTLAYRIFGPLAEVPILFVQGVGGTMPLEADSFLALLVDEGHRIIVFDNRDAGASTQFDFAGAPDTTEIAASLEAGEPPSLPYTLNDMANDAVGLLDALEVERAHVVGGSAGGMIAQLIAADHADRVASLTLISSTTNHPDLPSGSDDSGSVAALPDNLLRQGLAAGHAGDLRAKSAAITAPAVVIHGTEDTVFPLAHGRDLAATVPGAELVVIEGMGHVPDDNHARQIALAILGVVGRAQ